MLLTFCIGLSFLDPLTRKVLDITEQQRWEKVGKATLADAQQATQNLATCCLSSLYSYFDKTDSEGIALVNRLFYYDIRTNPENYIETASEMLKGVNNYLGDGEEVVSTSATLGKHAQQLNASQIALERIQNIEEAWQAYSTAPLPSPEVFHALLDCRNQARLLRDTFIRTQPAPLISQEHRWGMEAVLMLSVAEKALTAYARLSSAVVGKEHTAS